jgi:heterotetrameric sarcosine oxidase beta subunit
VKRAFRHYSALALLRARWRGAGFWRPLWTGRALQAAYDVVVVGAGGHGLATAYHLAKDHGIKRVAVLEKRLVGYGNVGRNTTIVRSNYLLPENHYFYEDALRRYEGLGRELNYNIMYSPRGVVDLALSDDDFPILARRANALRLAGIDAELMDVAAVEKFVPALAPRRSRRFAIAGALVQRRGGTVRHDAVAWGYARAATALGVDIIEDCEVLGLHTNGNSATAVETSRGEVKAGSVVFATAGHTGLVGTMLGVPLPIETHQLQAMVTEPVKPLLDTVLVYVAPGHAESYVSQSDRGGMVLGGHIDGFPSYAREGAWHRLEDVVQASVELLPQLGPLKLLRHWAGTNDMTMDGSPIIDRVKYDNVFLNAGWCYGGFKAIPASGAACATLVARGTAPDLIRAYRLSRFATGHLLDEPGYGPYPVKL